MFSSGQSVLSANSPRPPKECLEPMDNVAHCPSGAPGRPKRRSFGLGKRGMPHHFKLVMPRRKILHFVCGEEAGGHRGALSSHKLHYQLEKHLARTSPSCGKYRIPA